MVLRKIKNVILQPWRIVTSPATKWICPLMPSRLYLKCMYRSLMCEKLDLKSPDTYTEKLQWLKLYGFKPEYTALVDKYEVKKHVAATVGEQYVIKTYGVWDRFEDIDFDSLPERFVLKCTHDSAGYVICTDKSSFDKAAAKTKLNACLGRNFYYSGRERPYKDVCPRIIAEQYMEDSRLEELRDYKFFAFDGIPKVMHLVSNRQNADEETYGDFYDMEFKHLDLTMGHSNAPVPPEKPVCFDKMVELAKALSQGMPHVRVDFYEVDGKVYFGELTFYQDSGFCDIAPEGWNERLGSWINLG